MANVNSTEQQPSSPNVCNRFDKAFIQMQNLVCAIDRLASQHIDATTDEISSEASYYAQSLHQNAAAIVGVAGCLQDILNDALRSAVRNAGAVPTKPQ